MLILSAGNNDDSAGPSTTDAIRRKRVPNAVVAKKVDREKPKRKVSLRLDTSGRSNAPRRGSLKRRDRTTTKLMKAEAAIERKTVFLPEGVALTVGELADIIDEKPVTVIKFLISDLGVMASMSQSLDPATCIAVAEGFGRIVAGVDDMDDEL